MTGHFAGNKLVSIDVEGNAESVYFVREDNKQLIGINKTKGSRMRLYVTDNKIKRISYFDRSDGNLFPEKNLAKDQRELQGFAWYILRRPFSRNDILRRVKE
jgi:hypothetical protein